MGNDIEDQPAFPCLDDPGSGLTLRYTGMGLRDYFAAQALIGVLSMVAHGAHSEASSADGCAVEAYKLADAMMRARRV